MQQHLDEVFLHAKSVRSRVQDIYVAAAAGSPFPLAPRWRRERRLHRHSWRSWLRSRTDRCMQVRAARPYASHGCARGSGQRDDSVQHGAGVCRPAVRAAAVRRGRRRLPRGVVSWELVEPLRSHLPLRGRSAPRPSRRFQRPCSHGWPSPRRHDRPRLVRARCCCRSLASRRVWRDCASRL